VYKIYTAKRAAVYSRYSSVVCTLGTPEGIDSEEENIINTKTFYIKKTYSDITYDDTF